MFIRCLLPCIVLATSISYVTAEVGDVLLSTDHVQYPGEGEFQTPEDCVRWATRDITSDHQRSLAIFQWLLTHQWHLHSPQEWCQVGRVPGAKNDDYEMVVYDANRGRFSYGYGLCGTVHAWNEPYWSAAGFPSRRRSFPGHTNSEVFVDKQWRVYDTDMAGVVLNREGKVASYEEIAGDLSLLDREQDGLPKYPFAWPSDFNTMKNGWKQVAERISQRGDWYRLYHGGYAAQPAVVHLRSGETFTRYAHPNAFGDKHKRRFWHQQKDGPNRVWTFANSGVPKHDGAESNCKGRTEFGNAVFEYQPDLTSIKWLEGTTKAIDVETTSRGLASTGNGQVIFEHFSPYVICGDPVDDENPMTGKATDGVVINVDTSESVGVDVSVDQGQSWFKLADVSGNQRMDATQWTKGRYGWRVRLSMPKGATLRQIRFETTCQMCETIYPRLSENGSEVKYQSKSRAVVPVLPSLVDEGSTMKNYEVRNRRSENLDFVGRSEKQRLAYRVLGPKPASVVFQVPSRTSLVGIAAAARYAVRSPTPVGSRYELHYSVDKGESWHELGTVNPPEDNEFSSGWVYGTSDFAATAQPVLVRVKLFGGGYGTGLMTTELYGLRETPATSQVEIIYRWRDSGMAKSHTFTVPKGAASHVEQIPTGGEIENDSVTIRAF